MIPTRVQPQIASELSGLGGDLVQQDQIGRIVFTVAALDSSRDAEYLLEQMKSPDPLIKRACRIILDGLLS